MEWALAMSSTDVALILSDEHCTRVARRSAGNFYYGFRLLPRNQRRAMCALYAFLRQSDDIVDDEGDEVEKRSRLDAWRRDLERASQLTASESLKLSPILPALGHWMREYGIPARYLHEALDGVAMDLDTSQYETFDDLYAYCYRVASTAGLCCLHIWGYDSGGGTAERMAERCGVAFQLTNIVRDVREDALRGRVYLPLEDLERYGVNREALANGVIDGRLHDLLAFECRRAEQFYEESAGLERRIAPEGRPMLRAMVGIYRGLLGAIARCGYDVFSRRVALSPLRKVSIAVRALTGGRR
jgi:phytoene synthase